MLFDQRVGSVVLYNPLPRALHHYECQLKANIIAAGITVSIHREDASVERARNSRALIPAIRAASAPFGRSPEGALMLVLWPQFAAVEPILWHFRNRPTALIIHDPIPLRRTIGAGHLARSIGRLGVGGQVELVTHTPAAASEVAKQYGTPLPMVIPHPATERRRSAVSKDRSRVLVAGMWKPSRDVALLRRIGPALRSAGYRPTLLGEGWPIMEGWEVLSNSFVDEMTLEEGIASSACLLLPYRYYYQSGVAIRALELCTPVVGRRHPFLASLLGVDWPGFPHNETTMGWVAAVNAAVGHGNLDHFLQSYVRQCVSSWSDYLRLRTGQGLSSAARLLPEN